MYILRWAVSWERFLFVVVLTYSLIVSFHRCRYTKNVQIIRKKWKFVYKYNKIHRNHVVRMLYGAFIRILHTIIIIIMVTSRLTSCGEQRLSQFSKENFTGMCSTVAFELFPMHVPIEMLITNLKMQVSNDRYFSIYNIICYLNRVLFLVYISLKCWEKRLALKVKVKANRIDFQAITTTTHRMRIWHPITFQNSIGDAAFVDVSCSSSFFGSMARKRRHQLHCRIRKFLYKNSITFDNMLWVVTRKLVDGHSFLYKKNGNKQIINCFDSMYL